MPKELQIRVNTSTNRARDYADRNYRSDPRNSIGQELSGVNGDVLTIIADFRKENADLTESALPLTGALALRASVAKTRVTGTTIYSVQDSFNQGVAPTNENLASGLVTWQVYLDPANINPDLGTKAYLDSWLDFSWLSPSNQPQTLGQIPMRIYPQIDSALVGSPPPSTPDYMTAATALATFVALNDYIVPTVLTVSGLITTIAGLKTFFVNPGGGTLTVNLPPLSGVSGNFIGRFVLTGTGTMQIVPDGAETINGLTGTQSFPTQYSEVILLKTATGWISPMLVTV